MAESRMLNLIFFTNVESYFLIMSNLVFINIEIVVECFEIILNVESSIFKC